MYGLPKKMMLHLTPFNASLLLCLQNLFRYLSLITYGVFVSHLNVLFLVLVQMSTVMLPLVRSP